ncbi:MAG: YicC/YloC family endoribonuclease [Planctomycetota bacterium]
MIRSMTGFGDASAGADGVSYTLELRSLNNKFFKLSCRLPEELAGLEAQIEAHLRKRVARGSFGLNLRTKIDDDRAAMHINEEALMSYLGHLEIVREKVHDQAMHIDLTQLLAMPGVMQPAHDTHAAIKHAQPIVIKLLDETLGKLLAMREKEGAALAEDLSALLGDMIERVEAIAKRSPVVVNEYHDKLRARVDELMAKAQLKLNESDLIREVAVFADRADIAEEITRLRGHVDQFREVIASKDDAPAGRTLDFLAQEMLREANTIGSKCNDAEISRAVVELKSTIDRIKEQVQNVE